MAKAKATTTTTTTIAVATAIEGHNESQLLVQASYIRACCPNIEALSFLNLFLFSTIIGHKLHMHKHAQVWKLVAILIIYLTFFLRPNQLTSQLVAYISLSQASVSILPANRLRQPKKSTFLSKHLNSSTKLLTSSFAHITRTRVLLLALFVEI